jgi:UDP-2,3-diacylglucosamine hydrolase
VINLFISDLHLDENQPEIAAIFLRFMATEARQADALYILGDFFETWIGDDDLSDFNRGIIASLRAATDAGLPIYIMHGNRDFLLGKRFLRATGCRLLPDEHVVTLAGVPTLLMHGDTLCTADTAYLKFRKRSHNWFMQKLFLLKSLTQRRLIATNMRAKSKIHTTNLPQYVMDVTPEEVMRVMCKHKVNHMIHGHTHRQAVHQLLVNDKPATRTVLAPWHEHGSVLVCDDKGEQRFVDLL